MLEEGFADISQLVLLVLIVVVNAVLIVQASRWRKLTPERIPHNSSN